MGNQDAGHRERGAAEFTANEVWLSGREWLAVAAVVCATLAALPAAWRRVEPFDPAGRYRTPYSLSEDYWLHERHARAVAADGRIPVVGDSVIWGQYVPPAGTLPQQLNSAAGENLFANMGVNGTHPAALAGLLEHYGGEISHGRVVLHFNPLWMASARHDLQTSKEAHFNHPRLLPQFVAPPPCYREAVTERLGIVIDRAMPVRRWARHIRAAYFADMDLPAWTVEHPYSCPIEAVSAGLPRPQDRPRQQPRSWIARGAGPQDLPWVEPATSLQWRSFRRTVEMLRRRGAEVFVIVGPLNEHMLTQGSLRRYTRIKSEVAAWLRRSGIAHHAFAVLPSELYADASHPLEDGYAELARRLWADEAFAAFVGRAAKGGAG